VATKYFRASFLITVISFIALVAVYPSKTGNVRVNVTLRRVSVTVVEVEKQYVLHILSVFVALGSQHAIRMCHIVICALPRSTILCTLSYKPQDFRGKK
jgi:hypothetical protein